jgi:hypothetical protein
MNQNSEDSSIHYTDLILNGKWDLRDVEGRMVREFMKEHIIQPPHQK